MQIISVAISDHQMFCFVNSWKIVFVKL